MTAILLRPEQAAEMLAIGERKLWAMTQANQIPCVRFGRAVRYSAEALTEWVQQQTALANGKRRSA